MISPELSLKAKCTKVKAAWASLRLGIELAQCHFCLILMSKAGHGVIQIQECDLYECMNTMRHGSWGYQTNGASQRLRIHTKTVEPTSLDSSPRSFSLIHFILYSNKGTTSIW